MAKTRFAVVTELLPHSADATYHIIVSGTDKIVATIDPNHEWADSYDLAYSVCQLLNDSHDEIL